MAGAGGVNMEQFEAFFQRADLDRDGRISGAEAVGFFQGSNLPKQVLAQIWTYADQNRIGYLSRPEFYNALKLVTVAQSKRDLTSDIVKAALYGPASAKIPAPQMNLAAIRAPQPNVVGSAPSPQMAAHALQSSQNYGVRGQTPSSTSVDPQYGRPPSTTFSSSSSDMNRQITQIQPSSTSINQQFRQVQPSNTGLNQQFGQVQPSNTGLNQQFGQVRPSSTGLNQQFGLVRPSSTDLNQQFGQVQPSSTGLNAQFGYVQPSSVGLTQQFGQAPSSSNINQQFLASQGNQSVRPLSSVPAASHLPQNAASLNISKGINMVGPGLPNSNNDWFGRTTGGASTGPMTQVLHRGPAPYSQVIRPAVSSTADPKEFVGSGNRSLDLMFGGDVFSANQTLSHQVPSTAPQPSSSIPTSSAIVPGTSTPQSSENLDPFEAFSSNLVKPSTRVQASQTPSLPKSNQQVANQVAQTVLSSGVPSGQGNSTLEHPQMVWPKMTRASIQKYAKVFMEVDVDRDGKISGEEARNLFLSWRLPREVLKQVWDLSDQDNDTMLSLREFCIALYLMERYREGRPLPSTLPNSVMLDETLLSMVGAPSGYGSMGLSATSGMRPQQGLPGAQSITPAGPRPPMHPMFSQADGSMQINQQNSRSSVTDNFNAYQFSNGVENSSNGPDTLETHEKVENNVNVLLDSREKLEFYRTKMQDLVLYKSRCDNRLNEITERAKADKGEVELLENKYQEKYKQVAEIHSKLTIEEASFREVQERKMELNQAIVKMEQGGSADGILQVRADRIQSDLEELLKALTERCKKHDVQMKSSAIIELPQGWQPGIPEIAVIWDEDWDKFEDEGFSFDVAVPANPKSISVQTENSSSTHGFSPDSVSNGDAMPKKSFSVGASAFDVESAYSADESKSPQGSPTQEYSENYFRKSSDGDAETHRSFDEPSWRNFDNNDDIDSVWGTAKESEHVKDEEKYFFGSNDSPQRSVSSPRQTDSPFQQNSSSPLFVFGDDSGSPLSRSSNSPTRNNINSSVGTDNPSWFDSFSGYDSSSFNMQQDSSRGPQNLSRFDSRNSSTGSSFDHGRNYSFDDTDDPFGSSGPFKVPSDSPKKGFS